VPPAEFIPIAEEIGLIIPLGAWVIQRACRDAATWPNHIGVAVNLSSAQFRGSSLVQTVISALDDSGLSPHRLELEITESALLADDDSTIKTLNRLLALGVRIAMDDFGTGYSSLSYLRSFPFNKIKIDRSFIKDIGEKAECLAIVKAIASLGAALGMTITAEGVETVEQFRLVRDLGCTEGLFIRSAVSCGDIAPSISNEGGSGLKPDPANVTPQPRRQQRRSPSGPRLDKTRPRNPPFVKRSSSFARACAYCPRCRRATTADSQSRAASGPSRSGPRAADLSRSSPSLNARGNWRARGEIPARSPQFCKVYS
jgi:EAL domain-containing protein (putative c-di-GMP-specific phosphodiesterase class I)